jgi:pilus assembly protein FimV
MGALRRPHTPHLGDALKKNLMFSGRFALTAIAYAALCFAAPSAWSLGLGKLQVQSTLGESLRAEIDVTSLSPEEASNLRVRVAPPESYRAAGVEYNPILPTAQVVLLKRTDGRPYLKITGDRGVQEPFVDVILELTWPTGRLVREYTMLFDPPVTTARAPALATSATPVALSPAPGSSATSVKSTPDDESVAPRGVSERRLARASNNRPTAAVREPRTAPANANPSGASEYKVKPGDSLSRIAARTQRAGVSLDQMLVSLYRGNPQAFIDNNMNRLKAGAVLNVPSSGTAKEVTSTDANQVIQAQSSDFGTYRNRLAGNVLTTKTDGSARKAGGKVQASVDDKQKGVTPSPDKLTLTKGGSAASSATPVTKKPDNVRVAELSKNIDDLNKVANATTTPAVVATPASAVVVPPVMVSPPVIVASAPVIPSVSASIPAVPSIPASAMVPEPAASAIVVPPVLSVASAPASAAIDPAPAAAAASVLNPVQPPTVSVEVLNSSGSVFGDNAAAFGLGGLALALLGGYGAYRYAKRVKKDSGETSFLESRLQPDSFFGASGGQRIDTRDAGGASSQMSYSLSQLDAIGDVDPVAEADVYLAYGRDLQAEEILKEAMRSTPDRMAIRTKLLEVYAKRRDVKGFELLATQLFSLTRGVGEDWAKAQELGSQIDPENPMFKPGGTPVTTDGRAPVERSGVTTLQQSVLPSQSKFDATATTRLPAVDSQSMDFDLDLDLTSPSTGGVQKSAASAPNRIQKPAVSSKRGVPIDFSTSNHDDPHSRDTIPSELDLSDISLDLDMSGVGGQVTGNDLPMLDLSNSNDPLAQKLELAEEIRQIGDKDGARALLEEVVAEATGALKSRAQNMLARLG